MPEFAWRAVEASGRTARGQIDAASADQAMLRLKAQGLVPLAVEPADAAAASAAGPTPVAAKPVRVAWMREKPVNRRDVLSLTHELSVMTRAGLPLAYALHVLIDMNTKPTVQALLKQVLDDVKGGAPLSRALASHAGLFGPFYISMVRAGEASGQLSQMLERLSDQIARLAALRDNVISAATYPAILLVVSVLSLVGMIGFVVPQFEKLFSDMGDALPLPTRAVLALSHFARDWGYALALVLVLAVWAVARWSRTPEGATRLQALLLRVPLIGPLVHRYQVAIFARTLGTLVGGKIAT